MQLGELEMRRQGIEYKKLIKYAKGNTKWYIILAFCLGLKNVESLISPWLVSQIVDNAIEEKSINTIVLYSIISFILTIASGLVIVVSQGVTVKIERRIVASIREKCLNSILQKTGFFYTNINSSDILTLFMQDIENISNMLSYQFINIIYNIIMLIAISVFLINTCWQLAIVVYIILIVLLGTQKKLSVKIEEATKESRNSAIALQKPLQELISNSLSFVLGNLGQYQQKKIKNNENIFAKVKMKTSITIAQYSASISLISGVLVVLIIGIGGVQVINGVLSVGTLLAFDIYTQRLLSPLTNLSNIRADIATIKVSYNRIERYLCENNQEQGELEYKDGIGNDIIFDHVSFSYDDKVNVLDDISFHVKNGEVHAFVGESGAGKTTIINLICGLWYNKKGSILINGHNVQEYMMTSLREKISIVSQNVFLLDDTIYNNIVLNDEHPNEERVKQALIKAQIWDYIKGLKDGWESKIGENGIRLSGGEKQRMAIARAIYRDSDILIFDEATSMLDNETENMIIQQALEVFQGKTVLMIAHRLTTIKKADCISVIRDGKVVEEGSHDDLLKLRGKYYELYQYQS